MLHCSADDPGFEDGVISWNRELFDGGETDLLATACVLAGEFTSVYSLLRSSSGQCDLHVNHTTASLAGNYTCSVPQLHVAYAYLNVFGE